MPGTLKVGGNTIATHTGVEGAGTVSANNVSLGNNVQFPAGHVIQTKSITYGFSGDINITDGDVGASGVNAVGGEVSLTLVNANAHVNVSVKSILT